MFEAELAFFKAHQDELVAQYKGKVLVLRGTKVEGAFDNALRAYLAAAERFEVGTFMLQVCLPGPSAYSMTISSLNL